MGSLLIFQSKLVFVNSSNESGTVVRRKRLVLLHRLSRDRDRCDRISFLYGLAGEVDEQAINTSAISRADRAYSGFGLRNATNRSHFVGESFAGNCGNPHSNFLLFFRGKVNSGIFVSLHVCGMRFSH